MRALEKGIEKGFEGVEREGAQEVNAGTEMERAKVEIQEREEKKALTVGAGVEGAVPKMNIKVSFGCGVVLCAARVIEEAICFRERRWVEEHVVGISCRRCSRKRILIGKSWKRRLRRGGGIGRRQATSTVSPTFCSVA